MRDMNSIENNEANGSACIEPASGEKTNPASQFGLPVMKEPLWKRYYSEGWLLHERISGLRFLQDPEPPQSRAQRWFLYVLAELAIASLFAMGYAYGNAPKLAVESVFRFFYADEVITSQRDVGQLVRGVPLYLVDNDRVQAGISSAAEAAQFLKSKVPHQGKTINLIEGCKPWKLTDPWLGKSADEIGCRLSKDKSRLWIWGVIKDSPSSFQPVFTVIRYGKWRAGDDEHFELRQLLGSGLGSLPSVVTITQGDVAHALRDDFSEL